MEFCIAVICGSLPTLRPLVNWVRPKTYESEPTPQIAKETIGGGGRRKRFGSNKDHFARMHGMETDNGTFAMNDMETLVESNGSPDRKVDTITSIGEH